MCSLETSFKRNIVLFMGILILFSMIYVVKLLLRDPVNLFVKSDTQLAGSGL